MEKKRLYKSRMKEDEQQGRKPTSLMTRHMQTPKWRLT